MTKLNITAVVTLLACQFLTAQSVPSPYEVATWKGFRTAAISYTFDDGCPNQFSIAIPAFDQYNFKMTLFTGTNGISNWTNLKNAAQNGHEVASHTVTHANLSGLSIAQQIDELKNCQNSIESNVPGQRCFTVAYPYCVKGTDSIISKYYIAGRICSGIVEPPTPASFLDISSFVVGTEGSLKTADQIKATFESAISSKGWCVLLIHGIDNDGGYSPIPSEALKSSLQYLNEKRDTYWVATFLDCVRYIKERNAARIEEKLSNDTIIKLRISDNLPDSIYNIPITVRRPLPQNWVSAIVKQNNISTTSQIVNNGATKMLTFDITPDKGDVTISKSDQPSSIVNKDVSQNITESPVDIRVNRNEIILTSILHSENDLLIQLYHMNGQCVWSGIIGKDAQDEIRIPISKLLGAGVYSVKISNQKNKWTQNIVLQ